jgi:hypothetical protein
MYSLFLAPKAAFLDLADNSQTIAHNRGYLLVQLVHLLRGGQHLALQLEAVLLLEEEHLPLGGGKDAAQVGGHGHRAHGGRPLNHNGSSWGRAVGRPAWQNKSGFEAARICEELWSEGKISVHVVIARHCPTGAEPH